MNSLTLDPSDPAVAEAIADCVVGEKKMLTVMGTVTQMGKKFAMDVESAEYAEPEVEEVVEPAPKKAKKGLAVLIAKA